MTDEIPIDYYTCDDCDLDELDNQEAQRHSDITEHTVVPVYV